MTSVYATKEIPVSNSAWLDFVTAADTASIFHHPSWAQVLSESYGYPVFAFVLEDKYGKIVAGLPVAQVRIPLRSPEWIALPFTDYCPVLAKDDDALVSLIEALDRRLFTRKTRHVHVRAGLLSNGKVHTYSTGVRHVLELSQNSRSVYSRFSQMHRRNIRKAERSGVVVRRSTSLSAMRLFYQLHMRTRKRLGVPVQPYRFFQRMHKNILADGLGFVQLAYVGNSLAAGAVFLVWNQSIVYKYGASDPLYWKFRPNNLLFWEVIRWGCENDYRVLDFGRTSANNSGLRAFKSGWGGKEEPLFYSTIGSRPPRTRPELVDKALAFVVRRSPEWVCRGIGELLYRYAA